MCYIQLFQIVNKESGSTVLEDVCPGQLILLLMVMVSKGRQWINGLDITTYSNNLVFNPETYTHALNQPYRPASLPVFMTGSQYV